MKLKFLGTKGEIEEFSKKHKYHASLLIITGKGKKGKKKFSLMIDYGLLHKRNLNKINPNALLITHAHPDHYLWASEDFKTNIKVYLTKETYNYGRFKPKNFKIIKPGKIILFNGLKVLPYRVVHSLICPAVGYKIFFRNKKNRKSKGNKNKSNRKIKTLVYNPDLIDIINKKKILKNVDYYIGDGASIRANLVRRKNGKLFGHSRITTQINWCKKYNVKDIIFSHLGKETIAKEKIFKKFHPEIIFAHDDMEIGV